MYICNTCLYASTPKFKLLYSLNYQGFLTGNNNVGHSTYYTFNSFISNMAHIYGRIFNPKLVYYEEMCFTMIVQMYRDTQFEKSIL